MTKEEIIQKVLLEYGIKASEDNNAVLMLNKAIELERERFEKLIDKGIKDREDLIEENHPDHEGLISYWKNENIVLEQLKSAVFSPKENLQ